MLKYAISGACVIAAITAGSALFFNFATGSGVPEGATSGALYAGSAGVALAVDDAVVRRTWMGGLTATREGRSVLLSCLDANGDSRLDAADDRLLSGVEIPLVPKDACRDPWLHRDYFVGAPSAASRYRCEAPPPPLLIVAVGGGGTELLDVTSGESYGLLAIVNGIQARAGQAGIASRAVLTSAAIAGADLPQTRMELWLEAQLSRMLGEMPCLRTVIIGHSHGGVTVTSVTAALDARYGDRLYGVTLDRTLALYDRITHVLPARTPILNVFQTNEGWHGVPLDGTNVFNLDESSLLAPAAPKYGDFRLVRISHLTLDDTPAVQQHIIDAVMGWATTSR